MDRGLRYALRIVPIAALVCAALSRAGPPATAPAASQPSQPASDPHDAPAAKAAEGSFFIWPQPAPLTEPISTDRPGFSDSVDLVPRGHIQLELGYTYTYDSGGGGTSNDHTFPQPLLRLGLTDDFEFRLEWAGWSLTEVSEPGSGPLGRRDGATSQDNGGTDLSVGFKHRLTHQRGLLPSLTLIPMLSLPTGGPTKTSGDVNPSVELAYQWGLTEKLALYGMAVAAVPSGPKGYFYQTQASVAVSYELTDRLTPYIEYYGLYPAALGADCAHALDSGFSYRITDNVQIDFSVGMGLNDAADTFYASCGLSLRL